MKSGRVDMVATLMSKLTMDVRSKARKLRHREIAGQFTFTQPEELHRLAHVYWFISLEFDKFSEKFRG